MPFIKASIAGRGGVGVGVGVCVWVGKGVRLSVGLGNGVAVAAGLGVTIASGVGEEHASSNMTRINKPNASFRIKKTAPIVSDIIHPACMSGQVPVHAPRYELDVFRTVIPPGIGFQVAG